MKIIEHIVEGILIRRYKRFFADVQIEGKTVLALVPNTGSMRGCSEPNSPCRVSLSTNPTRKIAYTLEMVKTLDSWIGVNTSTPNRLVREIWENKKIKNWSKWDRIQSEVRISDKSRIDFVMWSSKNWGEKKLVKPNFKKLKGPFHFVEVKNVSLAKDGVALFPDSVTLRGQKHIDELIALTQLGHTAELLFVVQRSDCHSFAPADEIDPAYGKKLRQAAELGVQITALWCQMDQSEIRLQNKKLKIALGRRPAIK